MKLKENYVEKILQNIQIIRNKIGKKCLSSPWIKRKISKEIRKKSVTK